MTNTQPRLTAAQRRARRAAAADPRGEITADVAELTEALHPPLRPGLPPLPPIED